MVLGLRDVFTAHSVLQGVIRRTPVFAVPDSTVYLKAENLQHTGSFKIRGAFTLLCDPAFRSGVVTASSGNHGSALAYAAAQQNIPACVVMPQDAPAVKVAGCRRHGAEVIFCGHTSSQRQQRAHDVARERKWAYAESYDHPRIIAGQGTVGLELVQQMRELGQVVCPMGGGGLISGIALVIKGLAPHVKVVGVEPKGAARMTFSLASGTPQVLTTVDTIADGLRVDKPGAWTFPLIQQLVDDVITVDDDDIRTAMRRLFYDHKLVVEPSGAATFAAFLAGHLNITSHTALIVSGGNIDASRLDQLVAPSGSSGENGSVSGKKESSEVEVVINEGRAEF